MLRRFFTALSLVCIAGLVACIPEPSPEPDARKTTLKFQRLENGNLEYCDENGECRELPYSGECAVVEVDVDLDTGATCERCILDDGTVVDNGCGQVMVGCVVVTLPDPDCVVCAYVEGDVIFSSCVTAQAECSSDMECMSPDGRFGRCLNGQCVFEPNCLSDRECPVGFFCQHDAAGSWGVCVPFADDCRSSADCPPGMLCEFICHSDCQGEDCTMTNQCAADDANCIVPEQCHGVCVPGEQPPECYSDEECPRDMFCQLECWCDGGTPDEPNTDGTERCECWGMCMPRVFDPCQGLDEWSCIERRECEPEYVGWGCVCPPCDSNDGSCICDCPDPATGQEYVGCHLRQIYGPCDGLDEQMCIMTPGCEPQYALVGCLCPGCDPSTDQECPPCDCSEEREGYVGCVETYRHFCEELSIEECERFAECQLIEVGYGAPCYCEDCDNSTGANCYCECPPPMLMCVPREDPRGECYSDADCPAGFFCDFSIYYPEPPPCPEGDSSCDVDRYAAAGMCVPYQPWPGECGPDRPCPAGMWCEEMCECRATDYDGDGIIDEEFCQCFGICVGEPQGECYGDFDCAPGEHCEFYQTDPAPCVEGDPSCTGGGLVAPSGICVPDEEPLVCWSDEECPSGMICDMVNFCEAPPGCGEPDTTCPAVCYGRCVFDNILTCDNVRCEQGTHCEMIMPPCLPEERCVEQPVCVPDAVQCQRDEECLTAAGEQGRCVEGMCVFDNLECQVHADCGPDMVCSFYCGNGWCSSFCEPAERHYCASPEDCPEGWDCFPVDCDDTTGVDCERGSMCFPAP